MDARRKSENTVSSQNNKYEYDPVHSKASRTALNIIRDRLKGVRSHGIDGTQGNSTTSAKYPKESSTTHEHDCTNDIDGRIELISSRSNYSLPLLKQFYEELMIPNFPFEEERDDLDDWIACLDPNVDPEDVDLDGPLMDVLLLTETKSIGSTIGDEKGKHCMPMMTEPNHVEIIAGVVFEYYQKAQVGLVSYITVSKRFQRKGIMKLLHPLAIDALQSLHDMNTLSNEERGSLRAIFAETNTINAGDAPVDVIKARHKALYSLGYRLLSFPYVQPPLEPLSDSFDNVMLLIYQVEETSNESMQNDENEGKRIWFSDDQMLSRIAYDYVLDFFMSVYGYHDSSVDTFQVHWYFKLVSWYIKHNSVIDIIGEYPHDGWTDPTDNYRTLYEYDSGSKTMTTNRQHEALQVGSDECITVLIIGAGVAGLSTAVHLAESFSSSPPGRHQSLKIVLAEANSYVGGRVRTVLTDQVNDSRSFGSVKRKRKGDDKFSLRQYVVADNLISTEVLAAFKPWPIAFGAEFVHGSTSNPIYDMILKIGGSVEETFDFEGSVPSDHNSTRSSSVKVFGDGKCFNLNCCEKSPKSGDDHYKSLIQKAQEVWEHICDVNDSVHRSNPIIPQDCSVSDFVDKYLDYQEDHDDVQKIKSIIDAMYAKTAGTDLDCYGVNEASREENKWCYDEYNFRTKGCFSELIIHFLDQIDMINDNDEKVHIELLTNCTVETLDSFRDANNLLKVSCLTSRSSKPILCDKAVVAVPLGVLKMQKIKFQGDFELSSTKKKAIGGVNFWSGIKALLLLKKHVDIEECQMLEETELFFCPGEIFSQVWLRRNETSVLLTGFVVAKDRDELKRKVSLRIRKNEERKELDVVRELFLNQLSRMLKEYGNVFVNKHNPSCSAFTMFDWSDDEHIQGIYSSPTIGAGLKVYDDGSIRSYRDDLCDPICDTVFFAGECFNTNTCATVQSAFESGVAAATDIIRVINDGSKMLQT